MTREPLVTKVFNHFGNYTFRPGSFKFNYYGELYDIRSIDEDNLFYGDRGWSLTPGDNSQFIVTKVEKIGGLSTACCIIYITERK